MLIIKSELKEYIFDLITADKAKKDLGGDLIMLFYSSLLEGISSNNTSSLKDTLLSNKSLGSNTINALGKK